MNRKPLLRTIALAALACSPAFAQFGRGAFGGPGPSREAKILAQFDKDGDGRLNADERKAARAYLSRVLPRVGRGGRGWGATDTGPVASGPKLTPADVQSYGNEPLFQMDVLRTLFLEFEDADWETEMEEFYRTDVLVPAKLIVDGKVYATVGVKFRGNTSYSMVPHGRKRSMDISLDYLDRTQRLGGYKELTLLNSAADPTFLRSVLYMYIARHYFPVPKANWMCVAINGESWGVYANVQHFNGEETKELFGSDKGARWKIPGSPRAHGGLAYYGDDPTNYDRYYEIKTKNEPSAWADLIHLCKVLNQTPPAKLETALAPLLDVDSALRWLALDKTTINNDGYWTRSSDYDIYEDPSGRFHLIPWDANETFRETESMGMGSGGGNRVDLNPLAGSEDPDKALLTRLLALPAWRAQYLGYVRDMAENWLDWNKLSPIVLQFQSLIAADVKADTHKLFSTAAFTQSVLQDGFEPGYGPTGPPAFSLKSFADRRRAYLLGLPEIQNLPR